MSLYRELRPDPASLPIELARTSLEQSRRALTRPFGQAIVTNGAGGTSILGAGGGDGLIPWVDDSEPPSRPTGLSAASTSQVITVHWDGTLEYGLPADFHSIEIHIQPDGGDDTVIGTLRVAGDVASGLLTEGDIVDVWAVALDDAHDRVGEWTPNRSEASDVITLVVEPVVSQGQLRDKADEILAAADDSVKAQIEQVNKDLEATSDRIDSKADEILEAAKADATAKADAVDQKVSATNEKVQENADAIKAESNRLSGLGSKVDGQGTKLSEVESGLSQAKQDLLTVEGKADSAVSTANNASSNASSALSTANSAAQNAQAAVDLAQSAADNTVTGTSIEYAVGGATSAPSSGWTSASVVRPAGATVWMRTKVVYGDGRVEYTAAAPVTGDQGAKGDAGVPGDKGDKGDAGDKGDTGDAGVSVTAVVPYWRLDTALPAQPVTKNPPTGWVASEPEYAPNRSLYTASRVDYSNGQWSWTTVVKSAAFEASAAAITAAEDAKLTADNAQTAANTANTNAQNAVSAAASAASVADGAAAEATQATATANSAAQTATSTQRALDLARQNAAELLFNGGFEDGADGWLANVDKPFVQESVWARSGAKRAYFNGAAGTRAMVSLKPIAVTVGSMYRFGAWYKLLTALSGNDNGGLRLQYAQDAVVTDETVWTGFMPLTDFVYTGDQWTYAAQTVTIPEGVKWIRARIAFTVPVDAYIDDCSVIDYTHIHNLEVAAAQAQATATAAATAAANADAKAVEADQKAIDAGLVAGAAQTTADSKNRVFVMHDDPAADATLAGKLKPGDLWWQTSDANLETYWMGEPNNSVSVLVDHSDEIEAMWIWNGSRWNRHVLYAQDILVNGSIVAELLAVDCVEARHIKVGAIEADKLAANALYGHVIKGGVFLTSNERLVINNEGLMLKDAGGNETITMLASNGSATFRDVSIIGGSLTTPSLISSDIQGGTVSGATVTGGTVQTTVDANRGIKLTGGNLDIYRADAKRFLRANEAGIAITDGDKGVLTYAKVNDVWTLSLDGAIQSGGEISGAAITGAAIRTNTEWQSSEAAKKYRGLVITDGGMFAYKGNGKEEYSMAFTAATGELKLDGAVAANASLTGATINGGVVYGATVTTNSNYASTDPNLRDRGVWINSNGLTAYTPTGGVGVKVDATTGELYAANGVHTDESFSIYDATGEVITSLVPYGINIPGTDEYNHAKLRVSPQGLSITSSYNDVTNNVDPDLADQYTAKTTFEMGRGGVSMNTYWTDMAMGQAGISLIARRYGWPTGFAIENGVNGININHPQYGHLQIGANGLSLVNDQGWGLSLSVSGWSLKWAGNHTLATGPTAGALYIDGREIKTV